MAVSPEVTAELVRQSQAVLEKLPEPLAEDIKFDMENGLVSMHSLAYNPGTIYDEWLGWMIIDHELGHANAARRFGIPVIEIEVHDRWGVTKLGPLVLRTEEDLMGFGATIQAGEQQVQDSTGTGSDRAQMRSLAESAAAVTGGRIKASKLHSQCRSLARSLRTPRTNARFRSQRQKLRKHGRI